MNLRLTNISSLQLFQLLKYVTYILIGIVFTKTSLSVDEIGEYEQFLFLSGAVSFFWLNGLLKGMLSISKEKGNEAGQVIFNSFVVVSIFTLLTLIFLYFLNRFPQIQFNSGQQTGYLWLLLAYLFFSVPANLVEYFFLVREKSKRIVNYGIVNFSLLFLAVAFPAVIGLPILFSFYGLLGSAILRYFYLWILLVQNSSLNIDVQFVRRHLYLSFPLILSTLLSGSAQYIDGFIVTAHFDEATFAIFRYGARELPLALLLANAFSTAMLPEFSSKRDFSDLLKKIKGESLKMANYLFPVSGVLLLVSHALFPLVFNSKFVESATVFNVYLLLVVSRLLFPQIILVGNQKTGIIAWASFFELILNITLSLWFVTLWGIAGVAYATVIAYLLEKVFLIGAVKRQLNIDVTNYQNISRHLIYSLTLFFLFYLVEFVIY